MRYFIQKDFFDTIGGRLEMLQEITRTFIVKCPCDTDGFLSYCAFPFNMFTDICIIYGHNNKVYELIHNKDLITEKNIYLISCAKTYRKLYDVDGKNVYIAPQSDDEYLIPYEGNNFGFSFDITDVELNLYNSRHLGFIGALDKCFEKIKEKNEGLQKK